MRQFSPPTNLLLACLAALGIVPVLSLPWYAATKPEVATHSKGSLELLGDGMARWFTSNGATLTGAEVLNGAETALMAIGAATIVLAVAMMIPALRALVHPVLRIVPIAAPVIVFVHIVNQPGPNQYMETRFGSLVALALTGFMVSSAYHGAELTERKPAAAAYKPPAPPTWNS